MSPLPDIVEKYINNLSDETKISNDVLRSEYLEIFSDPFIQTDPQFVKDSQRHFFTIMTLIARNRTADGKTTIKKAE